ncbi:MAG: IS630 family transposase [Clostridiales bacterium]|jgi:transposase|nr:IS630 family transposase [Clostridiales bacterium]
MACNAAETYDPHMLDWECPDQASSTFRAGALLFQESIRIAKRPFVYGIVDDVNALVYLVIYLIIDILTAYETLFNIKAKFGDSSKTRAAGELSRAFGLLCRFVAELAPIGWNCKEDCSKITFFEKLITLKLRLHEVLANVLEELDELQEKLDKDGVDTYTEKERQSTSLGLNSCRNEISGCKKMLDALGCMGGSGELSAGEKGAGLQKPEFTAVKAEPQVVERYKKILNLSFNNKQEAASASEAEAKAGPDKAKGGSGASEGELVFSSFGFTALVDEASIAIGDLFIRLGGIADARMFFGPSYICGGGESLLVSSGGEGERRELGLSFFCGAPFSFKMAGRNIKIATKGGESFEIVELPELESLPELDKACAEQCALQLESFEGAVRFSPAAVKVLHRMECAGEKALASVNTPAKRKHIDLSQLKVLAPSEINVQPWGALACEGEERAAGRRCGKAARAIGLTADEHRLLSELAQARSAASDKSARARIVLLWASGASERKTAAILGITVKTVRKWRKNYENSQDALRCLAVDQPRKLKGSLAAVLSDSYRSGAKPTFNACQAAELTRMACSKPIDFNLPFSHWSIRSLNVAYALKTGVRMSDATVGRLLSRFGIEPHKVEYWLRTSEKNIKKFLVKALEVLKAYKSAFEDKDLIVVSTDEKTGIQSIERTEVLKAAVGYCPKEDYEYVKHGVTGLTVSLNVATGAVVAPMIRPERKEIDYVEHILDVIKSFPGKRIIIICDNLNTHCSASLVWAMEMINQGVDIEDIRLDDWRPPADNPGADAGPRLTAEEMERYSHLGVKGKSGALKSMESRSAYLGNPELRCSFVYTPKHSSWINQVECWFSVISRHLLNSRLSTKSTRELEDRISKYIDFYNNELMKAHNWKNLDKLYKKFATKLEELDTADKEEPEEPEEDEIPKAVPTHEDKLKIARDNVASCKKKCSEAEKHIEDLEKAHENAIIAARKDADALFQKLEKAEKKLENLMAPKKTGRRASKSAAAAV